MKAQLFDKSGNKKSEIALPEIFNSKIREDIASKFFEVEKEWQPYGPNPEAGKRHVASGTIARRRHKWKGGYGRGESRLPKKRMWRRGTQFYWIGAEVSQTRGGRTAHPPKMVYSPRKINYKEMKIAMASAFSATANKNLILKRYSTLNEKNIQSAPFIIENLPSKTKESLETLKKIFGDLFSLVLKKKVIRAGRGKTRGRKYKSNAGLLLITGKDENIKLTGIDVIKANEVKISDLYPLGRLTLYTTKALDEISKFGGNK